MRNEKLGIMLAIRQSVTLKDSDLETFSDWLAGQIANRFRTKFLFCQREASRKTVHAFYAYQGGEPLQKLNRRQTYVFVPIQ